MTRAEAIKELQSYADNSWGGLNEAFNMAIDALREQEDLENRLNENIGAAKMWCRRYHELARNSHDVASNKQVTKPLRPNGFDGYLQASATKNQVKTCKWVSTQERLPEKDANVLILFQSGNMAVGWWHDGDEHITYWCAYTDDDYYTDCDNEPTHWMSLPEPPKGFRGDS